MLLPVVFISFSLVLTLLFFLYGFNHYYLISAASHYTPPILPDLPQDAPRVAIHLPIYNEKYVIRRLVAACTRMAEAYGMHRVKIYIIDDSDDDTAAIVDEVVEDYRRQHFCIEVLRRVSRQGFKSGALQMALGQTDEDFVAIFDADFTPPADFLLRTLPHFIQHERLGIVQSRWTHINRNYNALTRAIAIGIDVHFYVEQAGRYAAGCLQNFNGSGGVLRKKALIEAGGWQADTLAEDLDVSYRIQLLGYQALYLNDLNSPGEVPLTIPSFKKQQGRWACGSLRTARKLLPALLANRRLGMKQRLEAFIHLTGYMVHPLMFTSFILACLSTLLRVDSFAFAQELITPQTGGSGGWSGTAILPTLAWGSVGLLIILCTLSAWISPVVALKAQHLPVSRNLSSLVVLFLIGCGVSLSNTIEAGKALLSNRNWAFKRTPKYALRDDQDAWQDKRYQVPLDFVSFLEVALVCLGILSIGDAIRRSTYPVLVILIPYTAAFAYVAALSLRQSRQEGVT